MKEYTLQRTYLSGITKGTIELSDCSLINSIELPWNNNKVGISCIPKGKYYVERDKTGKHQWFRVKDVPGRTFIEIHEGHKPSHSQGCILFDIIDLQDLMIDSGGEDFWLNIL